VAHLQGHVITDIDGWVIEARLEYEDRDAHLLGGKLAYVHNGKAKYRNLGVTAYGGGYNIIFVVTEPSQYSFTRTYTDLYVPKRLFYATADKEQVTVDKYFDLTVSMYDLYTDTLVTNMDWKVTVKDYNNLVLSVTLKNMI